MDRVSIEARPRRCEYNAQFKAAVLEQCRAPGSSVAGVALGHGSTTDVSDAAALTSSSEDVPQVCAHSIDVIRHERVKYACPCCDASMRLAARPAQVIPKGLFTENAIAWIVTSKFLGGLPLYRQAALLGRFAGTDISRNTVAGSVVRVGHAVQPVVNLLRDELLDAPLVFGMRPAKSP